MEYGRINRARGIALCLLLTVVAAAHAQQDYTGYCEQALSYTEQDSIPQAIESYKNALRLEPANPRNALLYSNIGSLQQRLGETQAAIDSYSLALNSMPNNIPILLNRASAYMKDGQTNRAYVDYCQVLDLHPTDTTASIEAHLARAYIYMSRRDYQAARADYTKLLAVQPSHYLARLGLTEIDRREGKPKAALEQINRLLSEQPANATLYLMRASIEQDEKQWEQALSDLNEAIRLDPHATEAFTARGEVYLQLGNKTLARKDFTKAIELGVPSGELREQMKRSK
ncbi:MAG: tetratricopeptide repeat protein [Prevotellaceae bacterium]|jgi:tetratricopeptide (TPR) repeat protein|nr:tetratricopeptide repeat protein [Prevotellaceae bacterium]